MKQSVTVLQRKDCGFQRRFYEKPSVIPGCASSTAFVEHHAEVKKEWLNKIDSGNVALSAADAQTSDRLSLACTDMLVYFNRTARNQESLT